MAALRDQWAGRLAEISGMLDGAGDGHAQRVGDDLGQSARVNHGDLSALTRGLSSEIFSVEKLAFRVNRRAFDRKDPR